MEELSCLNRNTPTDSTSWPIHTVLWPLVDLSDATINISCTYVQLSDHLNKLLCFSKFAYVIYSRLFPSRQLGWPLHSLQAPSGKQQFTRNSIWLYKEGLETRYNISIIWYYTFPLTGLISSSTLVSNPHEWSSRLLLWLASTDCTGISTSPLPRSLALNWFTRLGGSSRWWALEEVFRRVRLCL